MTNLLPALPPRRYGNDGWSDADMCAHARAAVDSALEQAAVKCDEYPLRDPAEDGNGYWAAEECAAAIRALKRGHL
jgi:hypothetical protein